MASGDPEALPEALPAHLGSSLPEEPRISVEPRRRFPKHVKLDLSSIPDRTWSSGSNTQYHSYSQSPFRSHRSSGAVTPTHRSSGAVTPNSRWSPRASVSTINLQHLLEKLELDQYDTYGVEEQRDGFFDASFFRPLQTAPNPEATTTPQSYTQRPYFPEVIHTLASDLKDFLRTVFWTHQGVNVVKSLLAYLICYFLCLIPTVQKWLGDYSYFAAISVLLNHSGRTFGAQLDGLVLCILGASVGIGWGCMTLELSYRISPLKDKRGGLLEASLIIFAAFMALLRSTLVRLYQALMSAGLAMFFMCLVDSGQGHWDKKKAREFAVPFLVGQAVCLAVNIIVFPGAGGREVAYAHSTQIQISDNCLLPSVVSHSTMH